MTTITIQVTDEKAAQLTEEAERLHMTLDELVTRSVEERLSGRRQYVTKAITRIIKENEELYRRLA